VTWGATMRHVEAVARQMVNRCGRFVYGSISWPVVVYGFGQARFEAFRGEACRRKI
jgi:hypothetical protein